MEKETLRKIHIFKGLSDRELEAIAELGEDRNYKAGEVIFNEGSRGEELYILKRGKVRIELALGQEGDSAGIHTVTEGQIFGELILVDKGQRSATAECESDCELMVLDRDRLYSLFEKNSHIGYTIMRNIASVLARRIRKTNLQLVASILREPLILDFGEED